MKDETRIIIADDHAIFRAGLRHIIESQPNYQIIAEAEDGEIALNLVLEQKPDVPPQQLAIHFSMAVVTVLGAALHPIEKAVQKNELKYVQRGSLDAAKLERRPVVAVAPPVFVPAPD